MLNVFAQIAFQGRAVRFGDELKIFVELFSFVRRGEIGAEEENQFIHYFGITQHGRFQIVVDDRVHVSFSDYLFTVLVTLSQNSITDGMKGADGARYAQITIDASSEFLDSFVSKGDNQNFTRINAAFFYKIAYFSSYRCRFTRSGPSDYQRMIFFRKHDFPLFPVERYSRIAGFENVVEIELLRFDMA